MTPTVLDVARHLIRQRGVPCAEPEFIVAFLAEAVRRAEASSTWQIEAWTPTGGREPIGVDLALLLLETVAPPTPFAGSERAS